MSITAPIYFFQELAFAALTMRSCFHGPTNLGLYLPMLLASHVSSLFLVVEIKVELFGLSRQPITAGAKNQETPIFLTRKFDSV